jgi:hypothetical protein
MKKLTFVLIALLGVAQAPGQEPARNEAMGFFVSAKNVTCEQGTNTENCTLYYEIILQNRSRMPVDSVFGSFFVEKDGKHLAIADFDCYQAMPSQSIATVVKQVRYHFLRSDVYTKRDLEAVSSQESRNRELLATELKDLQVELKYLQVWYQGGEMVEY